MQICSIFHNTTMKSIPEATWRYYQAAKQETSLLLMKNLTDYFCNNKLRDEKDPIVILNGSRNYSITRRGFCHIQQRELTFTIMSQNGTANIMCGSQGQHVVRFLQSCIMHQFENCGFTFVILPNCIIKCRFLKFQFFNYRITMYKCQKAPVSLSG